MTKIKNTIKTQVEGLLEAGIKPMKISRQLDLKYNTVKKFAHNFKMNRTLPPKIKVYKGSGYFKY